MRSRLLVQLLAVALTGFAFTSWLAGQRGRGNQTFTPLSHAPVAVDGGEIGDRLRKWFSEGTAAGNEGDYYDNRDGGHSLLNLAPYPQLQKIEYSEEQKKSRQDWAMQKRLLPYVVFGNSSTSSAPQLGGSNTRTYYAMPGGVEFLFAEYARNNLYIYPEHLDHDPGHNGIGGYGDLFPTNTPYLITSQGSSGSDQPFMRAMPYVLAAFRPEVKAKLAQSGMLMPVIQMILRITGKRLDSPKDYLTGKAHPSVFEGRDLDALRMVEMAHKITLSDIPPIALIRAVKETAPASGVDCFEPSCTEKLADTPAVIARIFRGTGSLRKITVSAENSRDLNNRKLKFYWAVLRGNPDRIRIQYLNPSQSVAEITVPYQERAPIAPGSPLESNRIDIGVFVYNGAYYSPPAFVTFYTLDNEARTYRPDGRPLEIAYGAGTATVSVADWKAFFAAVTPPSGPWPGTFLRAQFKEPELDALVRLAGEFDRAGAALLAAQETLARAVAEQTAAGSFSGLKEKAAAAVTAARRAVEEARKSEQQLLDRNLPSSGLGASALVQRALDSLLHDPELWEANEKAVEQLCQSAGKEAQEALRQIQKTLVLYDVAESPDGVSFRLNPLVKNGLPPAQRLTRYERGMIERLNAVILSRILLPGIVAGEWRENYVDYRIASAKNWRDVYRYAPDGTPAGWVRYQPGGKMEFNADGLLVLDKDSNNRCIRARVVRYELDPPKRDSSGRPAEPVLRKVRMVPTDALREYEYQGVHDWKGRVKQP